MAGTVGELACAIDYEAADGEKTRRRINVQNVEHKFGVTYLNAWCHERRAPRQFRLDRVLGCWDPDSGEVIDLQARLRALFADPTVPSIPAQWLRLIPTLTALAVPLAPMAGVDRPTERQLAAVQRIGFVGDTSVLSAAQASAILSCKRYCEGVIHSLIGQLHGYKNEALVEAVLTAFVVLDQDLRTRAIAWNDRSFARGSADVPQPKKDEHFARVQDVARRLFTALRMERH